MLYNDIKPLQQFIIPDILNKTNLLAFSKGFIVGISTVGKYYLEITALITRKGKDGKKRKELTSFYATPLFLQEVKDHLYPNISFIVSEDSKVNVSTLSPLDFMTWLVVKYIYLEKFLHSKNKINTETVRNLNLIKDVLIQNHPHLETLTQKFNNIDKRKNYINHILELEQFSKDLIKNDIAIQRNQLKEAIRSYLEHAAVVEPLVKKVDDLQDLYINIDKKIHNLKTETDNVLQKYRDRSYWI